MTYLTSISVILAMIWQPMAIRRMPLALVILVMGISYTHSAQANDPTIKLSTLNWEPYTGSSLPEFGAVPSVVTAAFENTGNSVEYKTYSWRRAIAAAWHGRDDMLGYFPGYHCRHDPETSFLQSDPIGQAPLGFVYHKHNAMRNWESLDDLRGMRIGYVTGYASTDEFEAMESARDFWVFRSMNDQSNLEKLIKGQLDAVLIDGLIFQYLMRIVPMLSENAELLVFHPQHLELKDLFVCFRDDGEGRRVRDMFNTGLETLDSEAIMNQYFLDAFSTVD